MKSVLGLCFSLSFFSFLHQPYLVAHPLTLPEATSLLAIAGGISLNLAGMYQIGASKRHHEIPLCPETATLSCCSTKNNAFVDCAKMESSVCRDGTGPVCLPSQPNSKDPLQLPAYIDVHRQSYYEGVALLVSGLATIYITLGWLSSHADKYNSDLQDELYGSAGLSVFLSLPTLETTYLFGRDYYRKREYGCQNNDPKVCCDYKDGQIDTCSALQGDNCADQQGGFCASSQGNKTIYTFLHHHLASPAVPEGTIWYTCFAALPMFYSFLALLGLYSRTTKDLCWSNSG